MGGAAVAREKDTWLAGVVDVNWGREGLGREGEGVGDELDGIRVKGRENPD